MKYIPYKILKTQSPIFSIVPSKEWVELFLQKVYNINNWNCDKIISKHNYTHIFKNIIDFLPELSIYVRSYYINFWFYKNEFSFRKSITLLKHFVNIYNYNICYSSLVVKEQKLIKIMHYKIYKIEEEGYKFNHGIKINKNITLHFD